MADLPYRVDVRTMESLSAHDLYALLKMRVDVFVVEQQCAYPELDGKDLDAVHVRLMEGDMPVAAARILPPGKAPATVKIGRVVVSPDHRGKRLGEALMREAIAVCEMQFPEIQIGLSAQHHLQHFYESFGFQPVSAVYLEDGIAHVDMLRPVSGAKDGL